MLVYLMISMKICWKSSEKFGKNETMKLLKLFPDNRTFIFGHTTKNTVKKYFGLY